MEAKILDKDSQDRIRFITFIIPKFAEAVRDMHEICYQNGGL
jgi:hypothetical protein